MQMVIFETMKRAPKRQQRAAKVKREKQLVSVDEGLFRAAFQNSPAVHSIVRLSDSVIVEINDAFVRTLGYRREDVLGKTPFDLQFWVNPEKLPLFRELLQTQGWVRNVELDVRAKDGT